MRKLNFGSLNIDHSYRVSHIVSPGETIAAESLTFTAGGKGLNQSIALAKSGLPTYHAGSIGTDGNFLQDLLINSGVHVDFLQTVECLNGHAIIQVNDQGQNSIVIFGGSNQSVSKDQIDWTLEHFSSQDMVLLQNEISNVAYIAQRCMELNIPLAFNPSPISQELLDTFPFDAVRYLLVNETEAYEITHHTAPEKVAKSLLEKYPSIRLVMTLGGDGAYYADREQVIRQDAFPLEAVDTTGAGDTFSGIFLGLIGQGWDCGKALCFGCAAAAIAVTRSGAAAAIPSMEQIEDFLSQRCVCI